MSQVETNNKPKQKSTRKRNRQVHKQDQYQESKPTKKIFIESNKNEGIIGIKKQPILHTQNNQKTLQKSQEQKKSKKSKKVKDIAQQPQNKQISSNTRSRSEKKDQIKEIEIHKKASDNQTQSQIIKKTKVSKKKANKLQQNQQQQAQKFQKNTFVATDEQNTQKNQAVKKKKSKKKKTKTKQSDQNQKPNQTPDKFIEQIHKQQQQQVFTQMQQQQKTKGQSDSKSKNKTKKDNKENSQSINVLNRQMSRQCILPKSNFYLQKQDNLRKGLPVGRGSKKQQERIIKQRKKQVWERSKRNKQLKLMRQVKQEVKQQQEDESKKSVSAEKKSVVKDSKKKGKNQQCTRQQSIRILNIFEVDAGDYRGMVKQLKTIPLKKIRSHLRMHFQRCIDIITQKAEQSGRKIDDWDSNQKKQIVRELHRIRCTNRLLSQQNVEFRQKFMRLMRSYNDPQLTLQVSDYNSLYRKIEAFVRGYCTLNKRKVDHKFSEPLQQNRKHLMQGGYILDLTRSLKRQVKIQCKQQPTQPTKIDLQKIIYEWTENQEKELGKLYMQNQTYYEIIIQQMKKKFGERNRWKDFEILGRKIDHLVKMGINKMYDLTFKTYNRLQRIKQQETKIKPQQKQQKCLDPSQIKTGVNSLDLMTKFIYNNKKALIKPQEPPQNPVFKNISLLERQIFGHVQSFKVRHALVKLLSQQFPPEQDLNSAIKQAKQFAGFAEEWQRQNNILQIKKEHGNDEDWLDEAKLKTKYYQKKYSQEGQINQQTDKFDELVKELAEYQKQKNTETEKQVGQYHKGFELAQMDLDQINEQNQYLNQELTDLTKNQSKYK